MVGCNNYEFVTIHLIYETRKSKQSIQNWCKIRPSEAPQQIFSWYTYVYQTESESIPYGSQLKYKEWRIITGNADLFTFRTFRYDQCCIFLGAEMYYWSFYQNYPGTRMYESGTELEFPHCGCCIPYQYENIVKHIIENFGDET